jgi:DNA-binding MarR family transcriptional regulator
MDCKILKSKLAYKVLKTIYIQNNINFKNYGVKKIGETLNCKNVISSIIKEFNDEGIVEIQKIRVSSKKPRKVAYLTDKGKSLFFQLKEKRTQEIKNKIEKMKRILYEI